MKSRFSLILISLFSMLFLFSGCEKEARELPAVRTVLVYMIADNNLSYYANRNISAMVDAMAADNGTALNLLIYQDNNTGAPTLWKIDGSKKNHVDKIPVKTYPEQNSVDLKIMSGIIREAFALYPAQEKGLILWSHGSGWLPSSNFTETVDEGKVPQQWAFGQDTNTGGGERTDNWLELWDIRKVLDDAGVHFNFLLFDACHMANVEVAYELRNNTDYLIASAAEVMGDGFPYTDIIPQLNRYDFNLTNIGKAYMACYTGANDYLGGTISIINTEPLEQLALSYRRILEYNTRSVDEIRSAGIQEFGRRVGYNTSFRNIFYDMQEYASLVAPAAIAEFDEVMRQTILFEGHTAQFGFTGEGGEKFDIRTSCGLTVFLPELNTDARYRAAYRKLQWYQDVY